MSDHTSEPWVAIRNQYGADAIIANKQQILMGGDLRVHNNSENMARAALCVNVLKDIPDEILQRIFDAHLTVQDVIAYHIESNDGWDETYAEDRYSNLLTDLAGGLNNLDVARKVNKDV